MKSGPCYLLKLHILRSRANFKRISIFVYFQFPLQRTIMNIMAIFLSFLFFLFALSTHRKNNRCENIFRRLENNLFSDFKKKTKFCSSRFLCHPGFQNTIAFYNIKHYFFQPQNKNSQSTRCLQLGFTFRHCLSCPISFTSAADNLPT